MSKFTFTVIAAAGVGLAIWVHPRDHLFGWVILAGTLAFLTAAGRIAAARGRRSR